MADYDFSGLDDVLKKTPTTPIAPPVPVSAPEAAQPKYDFSSLDTPNDQAASAAKAAALFEASFRNPSEEAKKRNLSDTIQRMSGEYVPPAVMDVGEAQRQADRLAADHATRASPRTSAFLSVQENANVAMQDAKVMAAIEESFKTVARGAPEAVGNLVRYGGGLLDAAVKPFGLQSELTGFGKWTDKSLEKAIPLQPVEAGVLSEGWYSGLRSLGANTAILGTAAAVSAAFPPAAPVAIPGALLAMAASSGGSSVAKAQNAGASDLTAAALGTADAFIEYWTEKIGIKYLMDIPGLKNAFLKTAAKFTGAEMIGEQVATIGQDFTDWIALHPEKTVKEFGDERVHAALVTAVATVVGGGGQIALMKGVSALAQRDADKAEAENFGARLSEMAALTAQLETTRLHLPTAQSFWQEIAGDSSVFIDQDKLTETLAEAGVDVSVLPTAAAQMAEARPEGIEIPVSELMTGLANTKAADAIIQHVRMAPDAESIFEHNQPIDKQLEFFQQEATRAVAAETRTAAFNAEVKQIEDDLTADLTTVGAYGKQANATQAKVAGAWYATVADKWGATPLQIRDGWTAADGTKYPGWRPQIKGAPMQGFSHGQAMLNVGLDVGATDRAQKIDADFVKAEIEKLGVKVLSGRNVPGEYELNGQMVKELTYVPRLSRPLTDAEVLQLAAATGQEAIGQYHKGAGSLHGTPENLANWGAFNPEYFKDQMGGTLLGEQAAFDAQQGGLDQSQSSRRPTAKKPEDHLGEVPLTVDYTKIEPEKNKQNMVLVARYPGIRLKARNPAKRAEEFIQHVTANLLWLHDQIPADIRQRSKLWYDGARAITDRWSAKYGKSDAQISAVLAVYSPQKDWFMNVSLAERTLDIVQNQQDTAWSPEMSAVADKILADEKFAMLRGAIEGKKLSELKDRLEQAAWLRTFDEAHNNRGHRLGTPEGGFIEMATSVKGVEKKIAWPGFGMIIKALYILDDGSPKTIDNALGGEHKVRSFYNNIFHPASGLGFVTIDTHAVAAGLLRPLSSNSVEVTHNFGGAGTATSAATGMSGTYAYYQEAYRRAAEARGLLPREMQSITWEAVRELYTAGFKRDTAKMAVVDKLWSEYGKGKHDLDSVRAGILNLAGGVEQPAWADRDSGISPEGWASTYTGELLGDSVSGRAAGMDAGAGERAAAETAGANLARKLTNHAAAVAEYDAIDDMALGLTTEGGRVLNTDLARELSPEYRANRTLSAAVHEPASAFIKKLYAEKLAAPTPEGLQPVVVFTAGGTGAGKSTGLKHAGPVHATAEIVYDTNMNKLASAAKKIDQALAAGRSVLVNYTYRDPVDALVSGALPRAMRMGRTVPLAEHVKTHVGSREVIAQLEEKYQDDARVAFVHVDNSNGRGKAEVKPLAEIPEVLYHALQEKLNEAIDEEHQAGRISAEVRAAFRGGPEAARTEAGTGGRGQSQPRGAFYQEPSKPGAVPGPVVGIHFSKEPRDILASSMWGTGMKGAEGTYVRASTDKRLRHRITFYINTGKGITPESGVGGHAHAATITNLYDADADTLKIWRENGDERARESAVLDAGFDGFLTRNFGSQGAVVLLGERAVQVEHMGGYARTSWDIPQAIQKAAIAAGNAVNTGKHINDLQSGFNNASPEAQAAALAKVLEGFGKPNDAETVAGFLEGRTGTEALAAILATQDVQKVVQDRAAVVPPAVLPPAKQAAQALMANKQFISGQQNLAGWQKDVARIAPDIADQIDWSKLNADKLYWKDDIAKTLWAAGDGAKKGSFSPATLDLRLLAAADLSTFLHESSHFFLAAYTDMASQPGAPKALVEEVNAILAHLFKTVQGGAVAGGDLAQQNAPRLAPNGKPSKLNAQQWAQVRTPEFKAWFGDWEKHAKAENPVGSLWSDASVSKIVDENGEPLVVYHGTQQGGFDIFRPEKGDKHRSPMLFATSDPGTARSYSGRPNETEVQDSEPYARRDELQLKQREAVQGFGTFSKAQMEELLALERQLGEGTEYEPDEQRGIYHLFLNIKNPNESDFGGANWDGQLLEPIYELQRDGEYLEERVTTEEEAEQAIEDGRADSYDVVTDRYETTNSVAEGALRSEQDGAIIRNVVDDGGKHGYGVDPSDVFVFFDSNQVKSATQNTGAFSSTDDSILRQNGEVPAPGPLPEGATPLEIWSKMSLDQQRPYHEAWAEQGEQYFVTGKAPSLALESAFRTFANWLKKIYTSVKEFVAGHTGGALHPDTAAFFDRMLATEAEIKLANEKRGFVQLFKDAAEAGMTERGFADYMAMTDEQREDAEAMLRTRSLRDMKWLQNSRNKVIAALQADAKEARAAVRKTIAEELAATPLRRAVRWLKTGEMTQPDGTEIKAPGGFKMTKADVEALFPPGALADRPDLSRLRGMTAAEGLTPDLVAEMFDGFTSGEDLVRQLAAAPKFNDEVEALTNQRMLEEHSDLVDPDAIAKAADAAIHNDAHIRLAATELAALNSRIGSVAALTRAAKEYARQLIETKTSKTLKPWQFAAADTRARKAAAKALRKGERDEAATQMRTALVNAAATKLAYDAEDDIKKITDRFKKIAGYKDTDSAFKSRDAELVNAVRAILADFGIGTKGKSAREYLAVVQQHNPDLAAVLSDTIDAVTENAKDWQQLKISDLRDLAEEIDGLWFLAKRSKQIEIDGKVMPLHEAQQALYDRLDAIGIPDRVPGEGSAVTPAEKRGILFDRFVGALRRVEAWVGAKDGTLTGPFRTYMWNPIRDAADAYRADKAKYLKAYRDLLTPIAPTLTRRLIEAPELGYTFGKDDGGMGKAELLHAILHTGNESNKRKLLLGRGWATATENSFDTSEWDAFVQRMHDEGVLTKADYDFAQGVWNLLDSMKPLAQKAHRDVFGKYFAEVTANEFTNQFGTYAGGYVPAMTDPLIVRDAELNKLREGEEGNMAYAFPTTAKGFTKSRVEYNRPLKLDLRTLSQHIDKVLLFGRMTRPVNDVRRVMSGKSVAQALGRVDPQAYNTLIMPWLNRAAKQVVETPTPGREGLGRFWSVVRARAGMAAMFANVANSAQQITGLSLAAVRVRPGLLLDAMAKYAASPATFAEHVTGKSSYMATRLENEVSMLSDQINDILLNPSIYESAKNWTNKHAYFMQSAVDSVISPVVWLGGYNQAIEAGMSETDAVRAGDSAVRETQGSQAPEDVAAFETGSAFYRMFVQFAGYFNMNANLLGTEFVKLSRDMGLKKGAGRGLYLLTLGFLAPAIVGELIIQLFRGGPDDDDKDGEYLDDWLMALFGYAPLRYATAMVPGIGPAVNATVNTLNNKPYDDRISTAPAISMIEAAVKAPIDLYKAIAEEGKPSKAIKEIATLISMTVGVPASAVAKPVGYGADVAAGRVAPTSIPDAVRGTITGTASPGSKQ